MGSRRVGDGVVVVLGGSVIHAGALEVVSRAHGVLLLQCGTTRRVSLLSQSDKGWRPGAWVTILDVANECVPACHFHHRTPPRAPIDWLSLRQSIRQMARR